MRKWLGLLVAVLALGSVTAACGGGMDLPMLPVRKVEVGVERAAEAAFAARVEEFGRGQGFQYRRDTIAPVERGQVQFQLDRKDIQIAGADPFDRGDFRFFIYRKQHDSPISDAEVDRLFNAFIAGIRTVPGVTVGAVTTPAKPVE